MRALLVLVGSVVLAAGAVAATGNDPPRGGATSGDPLAHADESFPVAGLRGVRLLPREWTRVAAVEDPARAEPATTAPNGSPAASRNGTEAPAPASADGTIIDRCSDGATTSDSGQSGAKLPLPTCPPALGAAG